MSKNVKYVCPGIPNLPVNEENEVTLCLTSFSPTQEPVYCFPKFILLSKVLSRSMLTGTIEVRAGRAPSIDAPVL
jgi:hypothetical protein